MNPAPRTHLVKLLAVAACLVVAGEPPRAAHAGPAYPVRQSANLRYLVDQNNAPFLVVGDSPQALVVNITEADAEMFCANRSAWGFNSLWVNLLCTTYTGGRPDGSMLDGTRPFTGTLPSADSIIASDNFNRADESPFAVSGNWQRPFSGGFDNLTNNHVVSASGEALYYWQGSGTFDNTRQFARATVVQAGGQAGVLLLGATNQGLAVSWGAGRLYIYWYSNGLYQGELANEASILHNGDIVEGVLGGGTIRAKINGTVVASVANTTTLSSGRPGFETYLTGAVLDDWEAGTPPASSYNLGTPNEAYFAHVDRLLQLAAAHGLQVILDPIETGGWLSTMLDNGPTRCRDYGRYLGNRYRNFDNITWMSGNDFQVWRNPANDAVVRAVALGIRDNDTRHLHTLELDYLVSSSLDDSGWNGILGLNATYTYFPTYARLRADYNRANFLPNFLVEANYEFEGLQGPVTTAPILRKQEYWTMTSGATGQLYGNHHTWQFIPGWQSHVDTPGAIQLGHLKSLFEPRAWYNLVPDTNHVVVTAGYGTYSATGYVANNDFLTAARTADGSLVVIYTPVLRTFTVNMARLSSYATARWFDPSTGAYVTVAGSPFVPGGSRNFTPPGLNGDGDGGWVLVLETHPPQTSPVSGQPAGGLDLQVIRPNPFSRTTRIVFGLAATAETSLEIFDVGGRRVRVLEQRTMGAGRHEIDWKGEDDAGRRLAPGRYFLRLRSGTSEKTVSMVLIR